MGKPFRSSRDLDAMSFDQLHEVFDAEHGTVGTVGREFIRNEIFQRRAAEQFSEMRNLTREMRTLTRAIFAPTIVTTVCTIVSAAAVVYSVLSQ